MITLLKLPQLRHELVQAERRRAPDQRGSEMTREHTDTLRKASLWWASEDMTDLAISAAGGLPPWTPSIAAPAMTGFMWFSRPIGRTVERPGRGFDDQGNTVETILGSSDIYGVHWSLLDGVILSLTLYGSVQSAEQRARTSPIWEQVYEIGVYSIWGDREFFPGDMTVLDPSMREAIHVLGAAWLLMQQPTVAEHRQARGTGFRGQKKPKKIDLVQVIDLRRLARKSNEEPGHTTREYRTRWLVRGHWRQQRVGPGRKYVKPVFVAPHIKGPDGAPLKTERVHAWRR